MGSDEAEQSLTRVLDEIAALRDLFQRRLLDDKVKGRLVDELHIQLDVTRRGLDARLLGPLLKQLLLIVDRIRVLDVEGTHPEMASVGAELLDVMQQHGLRSVDDRAQFDPRIHEAVHREVADDLPEGAIIDVLRPGYLLGDLLLRPAQVSVVSRHEQTAFPPSETTENVAPGEHQATPESESAIQ